MNLVLQATIDWFQDLAKAWDRFWFTPSKPHTLAMMRVLGGGMLFYTHLVWTLNLESFLGKSAWISRRASVLLNKGFDGEVYAFSHLWYIDSAPLLWTMHLLALVVFAMLVVGYQTRIASILACLFTLSYCHRLNGALFGLDQVNAMIALYLMLGRSGDAFSVDRWLAIRRGNVEEPTPRASTNIAVRLIQVQMCVIYLFGGIGKMRGETWWDGSAVWFSFASLEYQSLDMTWMVRWPWIISILTHLTVFWETFYCFLVWPRFTRPLCLAMAVAVHGGIALCLGMPTFGIAMIIGNMAFLSPDLVKQAVAALTRRFGSKKTAATPGTIHSSSSITSNPLPSGVMAATK